MKNFFLKLSIALFIICCIQKINAQTKAIAIDDETVEIRTSDVIFNTLKNTQKEKQLNLFKEFYTSSVIDSILKINKSINKNALYRLISKDSLINYPKFESGKLNDMIKNSKDNYQLAKNIYQYDKNTSMDGEINGYGTNYDFIELTNNVISVHTQDRGSMGGGDKLYLLVKDTNTDNYEFLYSELSKDFLDGLTFQTIEKLEKLKKRVFNRQTAKWQTYDTSLINGKKYFTIPFYEEIEGDNCSGCAYKYNLLLAYSFETNLFYYLYDDPKTKTDDWKNDSSYNEMGSTVVTEKNPKWIQIN